MKKILRRTLSIIASLITLVALAYAIENWRGASTWASEQARLRSRHEPLTWKDLLPPMPPRAENVAEAPLFQGLLDYVAVQEPNGETRYRWNGAAAETRLSQLFRLPESTTAPAPSPIPTLDLAGVADRFRNATNYSGVPKTDNPARDILAALESRKDAFDQLRDALQRPQCRFPIRFEDNFNALLPHLGSIKAASELLAIRSEARLKTGDRAGAIDDLLLVKKLAAAAGSDPVLIGALVRIAIQSRATTVFWRGWQADAWQAADYQRIQEAFSANDPRAAMISALRGERLFGSALIDLLITDPRRYAGIFDNGASAPENTAQSAVWALRLVPSGWLRQNQTRISHYIDGIVQALQEAPKGTGFSLAMDPFASVNRTNTPYNVLFNLLVPALNKASERADRDFVNHVLVVTVCALERHRAAHGKLPSQLGDLVPNYLADVPVDPMDGKPLRYLAHADGSFQLYSVGLNRRDDLGAGGKAQGVPADWAWPPRVAGTEHHQFGR